MRKTGWLGHSCRDCEKPLEPVPLLFPVKQKKYLDNGFIAAQWHMLESYLQNAFILTMFGYAAPVSDEDAVSVMKSAWWKERDRRIEQIELINVAPREQLKKSWGAFFTRDHYEVGTDFYQSWCARHPRRNCEAFWDQYMEIHIRQDSAIPRNADFIELSQWFRPLLEAERAAKPPMCEKG